MGSSGFNIAQSYATARYWCNYNGISVQNGTILELPEPPDPIEVRDHIAATVRIEPPSIGMSPPDRAVVNLPTWLWVDDAWEPLSDGAIGSALSVQVEARPTGVVWSADDTGVTRIEGGFITDFEGGGGEVRCDGPGTVWRRGMREDATDCSYTFRYPSAWDPDDAFMLSATVTWELRWWLNGVDQGVFGTLTPVSTVPVDVVEIQTVGAGG